MFYRDFGKGLCEGDARFLNGVLGSRVQGTN